MRRTKEETEKTIQTLIQVARDHFTTYGYSNTALEEIVKEANVTRGALYHHFGSKEGLFHVVLETVQREIGDYIEHRASTSSDLWQQLLLGCRAFLSAAVETNRKRILLIDAPAVLGWETWRQLDAQHSMQHLREHIETMQRHKYFASMSLEAMTHFLSGALNESALRIAEMPDSAQGINETMAVLTRALDGFHA